MIKTIWKYYFGDTGKEFLAFWEVEGDSRNIGCDITIRLTDKCVQYGWPVGVERIYFARKLKNKKGDIVKKEYVVGDEENKSTPMKKRDWLLINKLFKQVIKRDVPEMTPRTLKILENAQTFLEKKLLSI